MPVHHPRRAAKAHQIPLDEAMRAAAETAALERAGLVWLHSLDANLPTLGAAVLIVVRPTWVGSVPDETWAPRWAVKVCEAIANIKPAEGIPVRSRALAHAKVCPLHAAAFGALADISPAVLWDAMRALDALEEVTRACEG